MPTPETCSGESCMETYPTFFSFLGIKHTHFFFPGKDLGASSIVPRADDSQKHLDSCPDIQFNHGPFHTNSSMSLKHQPIFHTFQLAVSLSVRCVASFFLKTATIYTKYSLFSHTLTQVILFWNLVFYKFGTLARNESPNQNFAHDSVLYFSFQLTNMMLKKVHLTQSFISALYFIELVTSATYVFDFNILLFHEY